MTIDQEPQEPRVKKKRLKIRGNPMKTDQIIKKEKICRIIKRKFNEKSTEEKKINDLIINTCKSRLTDLLFIDAKVIKTVDYKASLEKSYLISIKPSGEVTTISFNGVAMTNFAIREFEDGKFHI